MGKCRIILVLVIFLIFSIAPHSYVFCLPEGEQVVEGSASFDRGTTNTLNINTSDKVIIDYSGFGIGLVETVNFLQPSSASVALNRVIGGNPSEIFGALNANGQIFLINPNGILFGPGSSVNVAGLVASTLNIANEDFLAGQYRFANNALNPALVNNEGIIHANGGGVSLLGGAVNNSGIISAPLGRVNLASGDVVTLNLDGSGLLAAAVEEKVKQEVPGADGEKISDAIKNSGAITADGGMVSLTAEAVNGIFDNLINQEGVIRANSLIEHNGVVMLTSESEGIIKNTGVMDVSALENGVDGGNLTMRGQKVGQFGIVHADAIEGDGGEVNLYARDLLALDSDSLTTANAQLNGNGGEIIVFSPKTALFYTGAKIEAKGGAFSGNGGFAEVSGKDSMVFQGLVDLTAPLGKRGRLLIDPKNITINDAGADVVANNNAFLEPNPPGDGTGDVYFSDENVESALNGADLALQANTDITVSQAIDSTGNAGAGNLSLEAGRSILINSGANITLKGSFTAGLNSTDATAAQRDAGAAVFTMADGTTINTSNTNSAIIIVSDIGPNGTDASGDITLENLNAGAGHVTVRNNGPTAGSDILRASSDALITAASASLDASAVAGSSSVGTSANPIRVTVTNLEALGQSGGVYISSPTQGFNIGSATPAGVAMTGISTSSSGNLELTAADNITDSEALSIAGTSSFTTSVANKTIVLDTTTNALTGAVSFSTSGTTGNVTLDNGTTALNLGTVGVGGNLAVTAGNAITDSGVLTVSGTSSFTTDVDDKAITLNTATNALTGAVSFTTQTTGGVNGGHVTIDNGTTALNLGASTIKGNLIVTAGNTITDSAALTVAGTSSFTTDVSNKAITLDTTTNALTGAVSFSTSGTTGHVTLDNGTTALNLGTTGVGGNLTVTAGEAITDSGGLTVSGTSSFTTDVANKAITLDTTNTLTGAVSLSTSGTTGHVTLDNGTTALNLGTVGVGGNLTVHAGNAITDSGVLTVSGTSSFTTYVANKAITLDTTTNALTGAVSFSTSGTTGHVTLDNGTTALNLGTVGVGGNLAVTAGEAITDSGALTVSGTSSFTTDVDDKAITLNTNTNALTGAVSFTTQTTGGVNGGHVTLDNGTTNLIFGASTIKGNLIATSGGTITDNTGAALTVAGTSSFTTDVDDKAITLDTATNVLTGAVSFTTQTTGAVNGGHVTLDNGTTALNLGASTIKGNLIVTAGNTITDSAALTVAGTSSFTTDVDDKAITLDTNTNALTGAVSFTTQGTTGNVTLNNGTTALNLGASTIAGTAAITAGAAVTQSGAITATSLAITDTGGAVTLENTSNNVGTLAASLTNAGSAFSYKDADALTIDDIGAVTGVSTSNGAITIATIDGNLTVNDAAVANDINAGTSTVSLTAAGANRTLAISASANVNATNNTLTYIADKMTLTGTSSAGTNIATLRQNTNDQLIDLGAADADGTLGLTSAEINTITAGTLRIGNANSGNLSISSAIAPTGTSTLTLQTGGTITQSASLSETNLRLESAGAVTLTNTSNDADTLAANVSGSGSAFSFTDADDLIVGTVDGVSGITTNNGEITLRVPANLTVDQAIASAGAAIHMAIAGNIAYNADVTSSGGDIYLENAADDQTIDIGFADGSGNIKFDPTTGFDSHLKPSTGTIFIGSSTAGNVLIGDANFGTKNVGIITAGNIDDRSTSIHLITANNLTLTANSGAIGNTNRLHTAVSSLTSSSQGNTYVTETDAITLTSVTTSNGYVDITGAGDMTVTAVTAGGTSKNVDLSTTGTDKDIICSGNITATDDIVTLTATGDITDTTDATTRIRAGTLTIAAADSVGASTEDNRLDTEVAWIKNSTVSDSNAYILEQNDVTLQDINVNNGTFDLKLASGSIYGGFAQEGDYVYGKTGVTFYAPQTIGSPHNYVYVKTEGNDTCGEIYVYAGGMSDEISANIRGTAFPSDTVRMTADSPGLVMYNHRLIGGNNINNIKNMSYVASELANQNILYPYYDRWLNDRGYNITLQSGLAQQGLLIENQMVYGPNVLLDLGGLGYRLGIEKTDNHLIILENNSALIDLGNRSHRLLLPQPDLLYR